MMEERETIAQCNDGRERKTLPSGMMEEWQTMSKAMMEERQTIPK